jgi:hypothetical protein
MQPINLCSLARCNAQPWEMAQMKRICMLSRSHRGLKWVGNETIVHTVNFSCRRVVLANHELSQFRQLAVLRQNNENRPLQAHANFTKVGACDKLRREFRNKNHSRLKALIELGNIRLAIRRVSGNCPDVRSLEPHVPLSRWALAVQPYHCS